MTIKETSERRDSLDGYTIKTAVPCEVLETFTDNHGKKHEQGTLYLFTAKAYEKYYPLRFIKPVNKN